MGSISEEQWGRQGAILYTLASGKMQAKITNWGATIVSVRLTDESNESTDVVLGFDSIEPYTDGTSPYFGCIVGRVANRIKDAKFTVDGKTCYLPANNNSNTLHGGERGFDKVLWKSRIVSDSAAEPSVEFSYHSSDGEQGFPGDLDVTVTYSLSSDNELKVDMRAVPKNKPTPVSLAQHSYWNLAGHNKGSILDHRLRLWSSHYTPVNEVQIPTGELVPVAGTPFDFTEEARIGSRIEQVAGGYDHNYVLDAWTKDDQDKLSTAASLRDPSTGWTMELLTNAPGVQVYTGNFLVGVAGKEGSCYKKHAAICLETQGFPNAINEPSFPSVLVHPGQVYKHLMVYRFYRSEA